ncbi:MAG: bifunctional nuclease family protein [Thermanaerothrix sp.]|nr:bifunctional nuclease family protein [Thermanaerothrix sp.]
MALAVRAHVPILVAREVMDAASITPEKDLQTPEEPVEPTSKADILDEEADERLSVFEDFLQKLNIGDLDDSESGEEGDEENPDEEPPKKR